MSTADRTGRITQALGDRLACLGMSMSESVNGSTAEFDDLMVTIDPLGAPTPEQVAEVKASPARRAFNAVLMTVVLIVTGLVLMGVYIGATDPSVWTDLPFTPEPSGERAEPEESAR